VCLLPQVEPSALRLLAREAMVDIAHLLRPGHLQQLANILKDGQVSWRCCGRALLLLLLTHSPRRRPPTTGSWPWSSSRTRMWLPAWSCPAARTQVRVVAGPLPRACCNDQPHSYPAPPAGTAIVQGKKGQFVWTDGADEEALSHGVFDTYVQRNLRYSQARGR
jgi:fumarate hydratase class I